MALLQANTDLMIALKPLDIHFLRVAGVVRCIKVIMGGEEREVGEDSMENNISILEFP